jgi:hypothetical protein
VTMKRLDLTAEDERARRTLDLFKRLTDMSDLDIAKAAGWRTHQSVQQRRYAHTRIHPWRDVPRLAGALGIAPECFTMDDDALLEWVRDRRPDLLASSVGWMTLFDRSAA